MKKGGAYILFIHFFVYMINAIFLLVFLICNYCSIGQNNNWKVSYGIFSELLYSSLKTPDFPNNPYYDGHRFLYGAGGFVSIPMAKKFYLQPELSFDAMGGRGKPVFNEKLNTNLFYLNLPVVIKYEIVKNFAVEAGVSGGYLLTANYKQTGDNRTENKHFYQDFNFSAIIGAQYRLNGYWSVNLRIQPGIYNIWKYQSALTLRTFTANLRAAYTF